MEIKPKKNMQSVQTKKIDKSNYKKVNPERNKPK